MQLIIFLILSFLILYLYLTYISYYKLEKKDILNKKIIFNICIWNILHIIFYLILCFILNAKFDIFKHIFIFCIGLLWYLTEKKILKKINNNIILKSHNNCYTNIFEPHYTDLFFNLMGQILYILYFLLVSKL